MKKRSIFMKAIAVSAAMLMMAGCGSYGSGKSSESSTPENTASEDKKEASGGETYTLKIGHTVSETDPTQLGYLHFKELIEEKSNGRIEVQIFPNQSIAETDRDALEKVRDNTLQMANTMPGLFAGISNMEEYYIWNIPYIYKSNEEMYKLAESDWMLELNEKFKETTGVRIIADASFNMGWYAFGSTKKDVPKLDDFKGLKIRINETPQQIALVESIGITPVFISFNEVYQACQQGMVDGMMTAQNLFYSNRYYEVMKSLKILKNGAAFHQYIVNEEWYQSLPEDLRTVFDECVSEMTEYIREEEVTYTDKAMKALEDEGMTVYDVTEEETKVLEDACRTNIFPDKEAALVDEQYINKALEIVAQ